MLSEDIEGPGGGSAPEPQTSASALQGWDVP